MVPREVELPVFIAHYRSPNASAARAKGSFEFKSSFRLGSKANMNDARVHMLDLFGNEALTWKIEKIERRANPEARDISDGQLEMDFRELVEKPKRKRRRSTRRGMITPGSQK